MKSRRILFFALGWLGMVLYFTQRWIYGPLIPPLMADFHTDRTTLGLVGSASMWGYMFTPIIAGILSDRFGRKYAVLTGIFGFSALTAVCGMVLTTPQLFAGRFLTGMIEAFYFIPLVALVLELFPERPGFFLTFMVSGSSVGWFVGPALAGALLDATGSWRIPFLVTGAAGLVVAFLQLSFWPAEKAGVRSGPVLDRKLFQSSNVIMLLLLSLAATFQLAAEFGFSMWYPVFLRTEIGMAAGASGFVTGLWGIGQAIGRPVIGWLSDRVGYRRVGVVGGVAMTAVLALTLAAGGDTGRACLTFLAGFTSAAVMGTLWTFTGLVFPSFKGLALGIITTFAYMAASAAPISIGYIGDHYSVRAGLWWIVIPCALTAALFFLSTGATGHKAPPKS